MQVFKQLGWFFKKEKKAYLTGICTLIIISIINIIPPRLVGTLIDHINLHTLTMKSLFFIIMTLVAIGIMVYALRYVWRICIYGASFRLESTMRQDLYEHLLAMSSNFFKKYRTGDLMTNATNDIVQIQRVAGIGVLQFVDAVTVGATTLLAMVIINWKLAMIVLIPMPIMIVCAQFLGKRIDKSFSQAQKATANLSNRVHENIISIKVTKTFGQEMEEVEDFKVKTENLFHKNLKVVKYDAAFDPMIELIILICYILLFYFGATFVIQDEMSVGQVVSFVSYMNIFAWPMLAFGFLYNTLERGSVSYKRIMEIMQATSEIKNKQDAIKEVPSGLLAYDIETYTYEDGNSPVLEKINIQLKQGNTLGIVGKTGSGKTTLMKLLLREYNVKNGTIMFGGHNINDYHLDSYFQAFGYVPQNQFLFSASVLDNIRFGNMKATKEEAIEAAKIACVHEDIIHFSQGYETQIGERGVSLSGGQKQRIAIARAILLNPEILILDDSLSAVDAKTEKSILNELKANRSNKTTIIIAHRFSAVQHANEILVLAKGNIEERGIHEELMNNGGWYKQIYEQQEMYQGGENNA